MIGSYRQGVQNWMKVVPVSMHVQCIFRGEYEWGGTKRGRVSSGVARAPCRTATVETCLSFSKTMHKHIAIMTQLSFCAMRHFCPDMSQANSPDQNPADYHIWSMMQERVYQVPIHNTDESWQLWAEFDHSMVDNATDQCQNRLEACVHAEVGHMEPLL